ncbi:ewing's tumor-associated antigen 1-like [Cheilinus undulatus]|uniref:ewing's tumor-associated antigen 1-like n=1 Tax=Cheilinus undulatus TaxID=241271 RepID=UPI001BD60B2C|nr:ewing's tumor-associated antigen 1-like [Cheilinus undulatus]
MSEPAASTSEFTELWKNVSKLCHSKIQVMKTGSQMDKETSSPLRKDLQSPQRRGYSKFPGLNNGDSPGDVEPSQDIFWDPTSPTPANTGLRNTRVVEISDIVNRIAPKDVKQKRIESPLLQWIGDSAIPCTPDVPKPRMRKRSSRQSSVEDLMKLARQFDENMQQDKETLEQLNTVNNSLNESVNTSKTKLTETSFPSNVKDLKCTSSADQVEAELQALFDCSTQKVSGRLSQGSTASACSEGVKEQTSVELQQSELKISEKSGPAVQPAREKGSCGFSDDFDDDWENDDLLNDSFVLAITQNPDQLLDNNPKTSMLSDTKTNTSQFTSVCIPPAAKNSGHQPSVVPSKPSCSSLQKLCPKPKTSHRNTFKLEPNPHFNQQSSKISNNQKVCSTGSSARDISDNHWDDGDDDALLFQLCESVEKESNSQPQQGSTNTCQRNQCNGQNRDRKTTSPLSIDMAWSANSATSASRKSSCSFVRSNSLPGTSYQGWNVPMKGAKGKSGMSQSLPGSGISLGTFSNLTDSSGAFQARNPNVDVKHTVTAGASQNYKSHHTAFKRNVSDSAVMNNKVFVTSQMTGKCSAAEIEKKKQEALARRKLRMQNTQKL